MVNAPSAEADLIIRNLVILIFLVVETGEDIKRRELSLPVLAFFGALVILWDGFFSRGTDLYLCLAGAGLGAVMFCVSKATRGKLGEGDAISMAIICGIFGILRGGIIIFGAFMLGAVFGSAKAIAGKGSWSSSYPFMPFLLTSHLLLMLG